MPIYEYKCECSKEKEVLLPFDESGSLQACECGKVMQRRFSTMNYRLNKSGSEMATDMLNSNATQGKYKGYVEKLAAQGLKS